MSRVVWVSDTHLIADGGSGGIDPLSEQEATALANHLNGLNPDHIIDSGDLGERHGTTADYEAYRDAFYNILSVQPNFLRGNHDANTTGDETVFTTFDTTFPSAAYPYRWVVDWVAPQIYLIGFHATRKSGGLAQVESSELTWLQTQVESLPTGYKCIIFCHFPRLAAYGDNITDADGGTTLDTILSDNSSDILAYCSGHRHNDPNSTLTSGVYHINGPACSYIIGDNDGAYFIIEHSGTDVIFHCRKALYPYGVFEVATWTPLTISLT